LYGYWTLDDADSSARAVVIKQTTDGNTRIAFSERFAFRLVDEDTGAVCEAEDDEPEDTADPFVDVEGAIPGGTVLELGGTVPCGDTTKTWTGAELGPVVEGLLRSVGVWDEIGENLQDELSALTGDITVTIDPSAQTIELDLEIDDVTIAGTDFDFWNAASVALGTSDGPCVPDPLIDPMQGDWVGDATCDP